VSKSEIRKFLFALQRTRCYWGLSPIAYFHHLQEQQANLDELNKTFSDADLNEIWESTFYPRHLRALLTPELREKMADADETGGITPNDIREFMMATDKLKADESLRSKHNSALSSTHPSQKQILSRKGPVAASPCKGMGQWH
jgi:hypothetical protein